MKKARNEGSIFIADEEGENQSKGSVKEMLKPSHDCDSGFSVWQHHPVSDQNAAALAAATCEFQAKFQCDFVKVTPASSYQLRDYGQTDLWNEDPIGRRTFGPPIVSCAKDWQTIITPPRHDDHLKEHVQALREIRKRVGQDTPVVQTVFDPLFQARTMARSVWRCHLEEFPDIIDAALAAITLRTQKTVEAFREAGADGIFLAIQHAGENEMGHLEYAELGLPNAMKCFKAAGEDAYNLVHLHGSGFSESLLESFPGVTVHFSFDANPHLEDGRKTNHHVRLAGGPTPTWLAQASEAEVERTTIELLEKMSDRKFTLSAGCALLLATPERNIHMLRECLKRHSKQRGI